MSKRASAMVRQARQAQDVLLSLLQPCGVHGRGNRLEDMLYRAHHTARPDGYKSSSVSAIPSLSKPSSQAALRTSETDPLRRKREAGFADDTSVETDAEGRICPECGGKGRMGIITPRGVEERPCGDCRGSGERDIRDIVESAALEMAELLNRVELDCRRMDKLRQVVLNASPEKDPPLPFCDACHRKIYPRQPLKSEQRKQELHATVEMTFGAHPRGLCEACYTAYTRWRDLDEGNKTDDEPADRLRFRQQRAFYVGHTEQTCEQCAEERRKAPEPERRAG